MNPVVAILRYQLTKESESIKFETCRLMFNAWFKLSPTAARDWLNRKLEDARREDAKSSPR